MNTNNIKNNQRDRGFTIVELLVVIVVIGILAAITIVSYTGVTNRANTAKAATNASSIAKVADICFTETNSYPATTGAFATCTTTAKPPSGVTPLICLPGANGTTFTGTELLNATTGTNQVGWACTGTGPNCAAATGGRITYWDLTTGARSTSVIFVGAATTASVFYAPAS